MTKLRRLVRSAPCNPWAARDLGRIQRGKPGSSPIRWGKNLKAAYGAMDAVEERQSRSIASPQRTLSP